jgi:hypothetical protein
MLIALSSATGSCVTPAIAKRPEHQDGNVYAFDAKAAVHVRAVFDRLSPALLVLLPEGQTQHPPEIWVLDVDYVQDFANSATKFTSLGSGYRAIILLGRRSFEDIEYSIAHELVHIYLHTKPYLAPVIEEGMACVLGWIVAGHNYAAYWLNELEPLRATGPTWRQAIENVKTTADLVGMSYQDFMRHRAAGVEIVIRQGWREILNEHNRQRAPLKNGHSKEH